MRASAAGHDLIKRFEGCQLKAYQCSAGVWTIGWGTTGHVAQQGRMVAIGEGMTCNQTEADLWFIQRLAQFEAGVSRLVKIEISQPMFDALVSFAYNCGLDEDADTVAEGLGDSTLLRRLNALDYLGAAAEFLKWDKANSRVLNGLKRRREAEQALFMSGIPKGK